MTEEYKNFSGVALMHEATELTVRDILNRKLDDICEDLFSQQVLALFRGEEYGARNIEAISNKVKDVKEMLISPGS